MEIRGWSALRAGLSSEFRDEHFCPDGTVRPIADALWQYLDQLGPDALNAHQQAAERELRGIGVTFGTGLSTTATATSTSTTATSTATRSITAPQVPASGAATALLDDPAERPWPFDVIPRMVATTEWDEVEQGLVQRLRALNRFIDDCYHEQNVLQAGIVPSQLVMGSPNFRPECVGAEPAGGIWAHICGSDLVRDADGSFYVLEDNLRTPSGVSYMLENRMVAKRVFPELFRSYSVDPIDPYIDRLGSLLASVAQSKQGAPTIVVLTPGLHNAAYFEHTFLAQQMGVELVTADDLVVLGDGTVTMKTIDGLEKVDVIYRRIDDLYLDPEVFRRDSLIGVHGLIRAWRNGKVAIVNAPGAGVADDKALYPFVPDMIRFYLDEEPILPNVPTYQCDDPDSMEYVLGNLPELVVKPANEAGGYGIVIGPKTDPEALKIVARRIAQNPRGWVAQPVMALSTVPTICEGETAPRHVDLRPFTLLGPSGAYVTRGGLTRVARQAGSLIVNSSQGGGSKDTWIVDPCATTGAPRPDAEGRSYSPLENLGLYRLLTGHD